MIFGTLNGKPSLFNPPQRGKYAVNGNEGEVITLPTSPAPKAARGLLGRRQPMALPGPISGFGGGTWNLDGSPATPDQNGGMNQLPGTTPQPVLNAAEAAPNHWTVDGFEQMRSQQQPMSNDHGPLPEGPLGGSFRQPFDYAAAMKALEGEQWKPKWWQVGLAALGDAFAAQNGQGPIASQALMARRDASMARHQKALETIMGWQHGDWQNQNEADLRASAPFSSGRDRVQYDPATGQSHVIYDGPEDFETYAQQLNLKPGTDEYFKAVEDYVLKGSGPSAHERDIEMDDHRTGNDASLERLRYGNRVGLENIRQGNRQGMVDYRNAHPTPSRLRSAGSPRQQVVSVKTPAEAARLAPGTHYRGPDGVVRER